MTRSPVLLALDALAVYRLTRLIAEDSITRPLREWLIGRKPANSMNLGGERIMVARRAKVAELLGCPWCISVHVAAVVVALQALAPAAWLYAAAALAFSAICGLISEHS